MTNIRRTTTGGWISAIGLWEYKECNHFSCFSTMWRCSILHSSKLLQACHEKMDFRSFGVQGWNFWRKGHFWLHFHCGLVYRTSNSRCWISPYLSVLFYLPRKIPHLSLQWTMALDLCTKRMGKQDLIVRSRVVLFLQRILHFQHFYRSRLSMHAREMSLVPGKIWSLHAKMVP